MLLAQIALVPENSNVGITESNLARVAAALQKQVTRDFGPIWKIDATVDAFPSLEDVPLGYWPIVISGDAPDYALGYHSDNQGQPFSIVKFNANWSLTASHECLEMLADPFGNRLVSSTSLMQDQGRVSYLVEVCDPCESAAFAYTSNGVWVSDFYTPAFFDPQAASGVRYDFNGNIKQPRQVQKGGYISWHDPVSDEWWQQQFFNSQPEFKNLGKLTNVRNIREAIDEKTRVENIRPEVVGLPEDDKLLQTARQVWNKAGQSSYKRAAMLHKEIQGLKNGAKRRAERERSAKNKSAALP